jgi:hypothetical protein
MHSSNYLVGVYRTPISPTWPLLQQPQTLVSLGAAVLTIDIRM